MFLENRDVLNFWSLRTNVKVVIKAELHGAESFRRRRQQLSYSRISEHFKEPEGSLLCPLVSIQSHINPFQITQSYLSIFPPSTHV
jgi:hypothetical protein